MGYHFCNRRDKSTTGEALVKKLTIDSSIIISSLLTANIQNLS